MNNRNVYAFVLLLGFSLIFAGCMENETETPIVEGEAIETGGKAPAFSIFELVTVDLGNGVFSDGEVEGTTLERVKIPLTIQGNKLTFMVPKLNPGSYKLVFLEKDKPFNIGFEVKAHTLKETPAKYLESWNKNQQEKILLLEKIKSVLSVEKKDLLEKDIALLKKQNEELSAKAALLKENELTDLAYFLEANKVWMEEISISFGQFNSVVSTGQTGNNLRVNTEELSNQLMQKLPVAVATVGKHLPKIVKAVSLGFSPGSLVPVIGDSAGVAMGLGMSVGYLVLDIQELFAQIDSNAEYVRVVADQIMDSRLKADYSFDSGVKYELIVSRNYRTLFKGDETSTIPAVKNYLGSIGLMLAEWAKVKSKLPLSLSYSPTNPIILPSFTSKSLVVHSNHLGMTGISNPKVTGVATKESGKFMLTFNTAESGTQEFNFKLVYENQLFGKLEKTLDAAVIKGPEYGSITDPRDGKVYKTVKIGTQTWFAENLRYAGNISQVTSNQDWAALNSGNPQPAWSYFNNNAENDAIYGKLYNWYAVSTGTLCPPGWHIPTDGEWTVLTNFIGGEEVAGGKMKSVTGWASPNISATNESGFTGLPGGLRINFGEFANLGANGNWWSSSPRFSNDSWARYLFNSSGGFARGGSYREEGFSCRCLKD